VNNLERPEDQELHRGILGVCLRPDSVTPPFEGSRAPSREHLSGLPAWMKRRLHRRNMRSGVEEGLRRPDWLRRSFVAGAWPSEAPENVTVVDSDRVTQEVAGPGTPGLSNVGNGLGAERFPATELPPHIPSGQPAPWSICAGSTPRLGGFTRGR
jgi:hypothetical protein